MAQVSPPSPGSPSPAPASGAPSTVRLDVRTGTSTVTSYAVGEIGFLLGSVPGCDLRLPGSNLPPVLALIARQANGASVRKLAPIGGLLLNGHPVTHSPLQDGDRITFGPVEITVSLSVPAPVPVMRVRLYDGSEGPAEAPDRLLRERAEKLAEVRAELEHREETLREERNDLAVQRNEIAERTEQLAKQAEDLNGVRREMTELRQRLYQRYRQGRDRLAGLQQSVRRAARRLQERKRRFEAELLQARALTSGDGDPRTELTALARGLTEKARAVQEKQQQLQEREREFQAEVARRQAEGAAREQRLADEREALRKSQAQHQTDLVRLDRLAATLEQRQRQLQKQALEVDRRFESLQRHTRELEEQATQLDEWHARLIEKSQEGEKQAKELEAARAELAARNAAVEGQQAMLATLRMRLERLREDHRRQEEDLSEQRVRQDDAEAEIQERLAEARRLAEELHAEKQLRDEQHRQFEERRATLEVAVGQLRQAQERLVAETEHLQRRGAEVDAVAAEQQEQAALLQARTAELGEQQECLRADRQALGERASVLARAEQVLATLQEQLRRRSEEFAERQRALDEQARRDESARAEVEARRAEIERERLHGEEQLSALRRDLETSRAELEQQRQDLAGREQALKADVDELAQVRQRLDAERAAVAADRGRLEAEQRQAVFALEQSRTEAEAAQREAEALRGELPELEQRAQAALERLTQAREQLRDGLAEIHGYVRKGRDDLEALRGQARAEQEALRVQQQALYTAQDEHRLAVAAFRQELIDWQGQLGELKLTLARDETRLERRQAEVEEQAQQVASTSQRLAEQAQQLQHQQRVVAERRQEVDRHLADMREWYRRKLRELAQGRETEDIEAREGEAPAEPGTEGSAGASPSRRTGEVDAGDRQLGDLLRSLELVDADTLTALLAEARRQRKSLRQLLLAGNYLTLFQMALIEAGNLDGLVLGPVRTIDRLHSTPREAVYRVFDPRSNREALLRHLAESEMHDAVRPDEFRQRFAAATAVCHPHVAATYEVLEIAGRPAVLQEWLSGLASNEWPALAAVPGVWFRLVSQAALGLQTAHQAGLVHGNLQPGQVVFTPEGVLKLCGFGEPAWLALEHPRERVAPPEDIDGDVAGDLAALGRCALAWTTPPADRKGPKPKPLPESLQAVLRRLGGEAGSEPYPSAAVLLEELDAAGAAVPANAAAWERFVRQVREQSTDSPLRRSA